MRINANASLSDGTDLILRAREFFITARWDGSELVTINAALTYVRLSLMQIDPGRLPDPEMRRVLHNLHRMHDEYVVFMSRPREMSELDTDTAVESMLLIVKHVNWLADYLIELRAKSTN